MSLDGLRAWIGEVERKLGMRTRAFLVLVAIAVGGAGAAVYLAIEAGDEQVSTADLQAVESASRAKIEALESRIAGLEATREAVPQPESPAKPKR